MSTPMKIPRTMNQQYAIIRAADAEQRQRKTCVKREATVSPVCRRIMLTPDMAIHTITIPTGDAIISPSATSSATSSATTPHAHSVTSQPNSTFSW